MQYWCLVVYHLSWKLEISGYEMTRGRNIGGTKCLCSEILGARHPDPGIIVTRTNRDTFLCLYEKELYQGSFTYLYGTESEEASLLVKKVISRMLHNFLHFNNLNCYEMFCFQRKVAQYSQNLQREIQFSNFIEDRTSYF